MTPDPRYAENMGLCRYMSRGSSASDGEMRTDTCFRLAQMRLV